MLSSNSATLPNSSLLEEVKEINIPKVPNKVDLNQLDATGNVFTEKDRQYLATHKLPNANNIIYGKQAFSKNDMSRRPAIVKNELYAIYSGKSELGKGAFGKAVLAQRQSDSKWCVLKVLPQSKNNNSLESVTSEATVMEKASDLFIAQCRKEGGASGSKKHYIMMELAPGNALINLLANESAAKIDFSPVRRMDIARQLIASIQAVHDRGYLHRDIKPHNFNYDPSTNKVTVLDFGLSSKVNEAGEVRFNHGLDQFSPGTPQFLPMEITLAFPDNNATLEQKMAVESIYNESTEVFALGLTLKMLFGHEQGDWLLDKKLELLEQNPVLKQLLEDMTYERGLDSLDTGPVERLKLAKIQSILESQQKVFIARYPETIGVLNLSDYENADKVIRADIIAVLKGMNEVVLIDTHKEQDAGTFDLRRIELIRELEKANLIINPKIKLSTNPENAIQAIRNEYAELQAAGLKNVNIQIVKPSVTLQASVDSVPVVSSTSESASSKSSASSISYSVMGRMLKQNASTSSIELSSEELAKFAAVPSHVPDRLESDLTSDRAAVALSKLGQQGSGAENKDQVKHSVSLKSGGK